jgi:hypothetical protein
VVDVSRALIDARVCHKNATIHGFAHKCGNLGWQPQRLAPPSRNSGQRPQLAPRWGRFFWAGVGIALTVEQRKPSALSPGSKVRLAPPNAARTAT